MTSTQTGADALLDLLARRRSASAKSLGLPVPSDSELEQAFGAAMSAPDHGAVRPWRFLLIRGEARERLGDLLAEAQRRAAPDTPQEKLDETRGKPLRAPLIIAVGARLRRDHPKVPPVEQVVAAAAAAENLLLALQAMGYGGVLLTGVHAHHPVVKTGLGLGQDDEMIGFLYVGTPQEPLQPKRRPDPMSAVAEWTGAEAAALA